MTNYDGLAGKVRAVPGVVRVAPKVDGQVMASANGLNGGVLVRGLRLQDLRSLTTVSKISRKGRWSASAAAMR